jgi:hypothetical protein
MQQLLLSQLSESHHVDVPEALMPTPCHLIVAPTHRQACRMRELQMEKVEVVLLPLYLHQQHTTKFSDLHHASVDDDLVANLIELADAHNVGRQMRDEVDPIEGPWPSIRTTVSSPKCTVPSTTVSIFMNTARYPDMLFITLLFKTHVLALLSFSSSRWANSYSSWISTSAMDP